MLFRFAVALVCLSPFAAGCANWSSPQTGFHLPTPQMRPDAVACEIAFLQWDTSQAVRDQDLWQAIDEQFLAPEVRRRLADNGLRIGVISGQLPEEVRKKLDDTSDPIAALTAEAMSLGDEMLSRRETKQCREGIAEIIEVLPERPQLSVVLFNEDGLIRGERFDRPRGFFELMAAPRGDRLVRLNLTPGIDHGQWRQRIIGNQGALRYDHRRDQRLFASLAISAELAPGQVLAITSTPDPKGIGATLFANRFPNEADQLFLLVRLSNLKGDDLFAPTQKVRPLISPQSL